MRVYTTQEAAQLTGSTVRALRKRIERGQLRAVQHGRYWRIPHSELERAGLLAPGATPGAEDTEETGTEVPMLLAALERERAERRRLAQELMRLRPLTAQVERATDDLQRERAERQAAEARAAEASRQAAELHARQQALLRAGPLTRRRLLRELRGDELPIAGRYWPTIKAQLETRYRTSIEPPLRRLVDRASARVARSPGDDDGPLSG